MNQYVFRFALAALPLVSLPAWASTASAVRGDYLEIRSCDVFTGPCFANGEMGLEGEEAVLAWSIEQGAWDGVPLDGLKVLAVVKARGTLGDVASMPQAAKSVLIVDAAANAGQQQALIRFAREMAGGLLDEVVRVDVAPVDVVADPSSCPENGCAVVTAGDLVQIQTRCLSGGDHVCGNEECFYPPLTEIDHARPAFTEVGLFQGQGLGITFDEAGRRSAYLGTFSR